MVKGKENRVIPRAVGPWESPGIIYIFAVQLMILYQEIATSGFALLAMTTFPRFSIAPVGRGYILAVTVGNLSPSFVQNVPIYE